MELSDQFEKYLLRVCSMFNCFAEWDLHLSGLGPDLVLLCLRFDPDLLLLRPMYLKFYFSLPHL